MSYLPQDLPQREEHLAPQRKADEIKYREDVAAQEREQKKADEQYQKDLDAYNKQIAEQNKKTEKDEIEEKYQEKINELNREKEKLIDYYRQQPTEDARSRDLKRKAISKIEMKYKKKINEVVREKQTRILPITLREQGYPEHVVTKITRGFRKGDFLTTTSATTAAERSYVGKQVTIQRQKEMSVKEAMQAPSYTKEQTTQIEAGSAGLLGSPTPEMEARAEKIKPTPDIITGRQSVESRARLTNVDTGQSIIGGHEGTPSRTVTITTASGGFDIIQKNGIATASPTGKTILTETTRIIPERPPSKGVSPKTNPVALIAGMFNQNLDAAGKPIERKSEPSNIDILKDTLSRYQSVYGAEQKAPFATVLEASLTDRGKKVGVMERLFIEKSAYKQYKTRAEAFGLVEAKGEKATFVNPKTGKKFSAETGMGDVTIGRQLGFVFDYNLQRPTTEYPKTFEGSLSYVVSPKVQGPQKPKEETVIAVPGSLEYALGEQESKPTSFNKLIETQYNKLGEMQEVVKKRGNILEQIAYAPSEIVRSGLGTMAMIVNVSEQYVDPFVQKSLGLKQTTQPKPIELKSDVAGTVILPYQFEKGRFDYSTKEWGSRQAQFIEKKGVPAYVLGVGFDYLGVKGAPTAIKGGLKIVGFVGQKQKLLLKGSEELQTVYQGITFRNRPLIGLQEGRLRFGIDYSKIPYERIDLENPVYARSGMEASLGSGIEKFTFYSRPALEAQRRKGVISALSEARAQEVVKGIEMGMKTKSKVGRFADVPFENLSKRQSDYLFKTTTQLQKEKKVEAVHGSVALGAQVPEPIKPAIKFGDIDIVPSKPTVENANKLIDRLATGFPLEAGQRIKVIKPSSETANRQLWLFTKGKKEPEKILEVVLKGDEKLKSGESIVTEGTNILGFKIPFSKSVKEKSFGLKVHTANYQLLTNVKQALAYQKGGKELFDIYPSPGRTKDIARTYLNLKAKAIFKGGKKGEELDIQAEKIKSLYNIDFGDIESEKIVLSSSPKTPSTVNKISLRKIPTTTPKTGQEESTKSETRPSIIQSPRITSIKPSSVSRITSSFKSSSFRPSKTSSLRPSKQQSVKTPSRTQYGKQTSNYIIKAHPRIISPPSRSPPPSRTPPYNVMPPSKTSPPSRTPPSYRILTPPSITRQPSSYRVTPPKDTVVIPPKKRKPILLLEHGKPRKSVDKDIGEKADFLGNVSESSIVGIYNRIETTYGQRRINKLLKGDVRVVKGQKRTVRVSKKQKDILGFEKKKTKSKTSFW